MARAQSLAEYPPILVRPRVPRTSFFPPTAMLSLFLAPLLISAITRAGAYKDVDRAEVSDKGPVPKINVVDPGSSIIVKLDCAGCPFMIPKGYPTFGEEFDSRPNSLVRRLNADGFDNVLWTGLIGAMANVVSHM